MTGAPASQTGLSQAEPCSTVSALTGFDPSRKSDVFQVQLDLQQRANTLDEGVVAAKALYWLYDYGRQALNGSDYGTEFSGHKQAEPYLKAALKVFASSIYAHAVSLALADVERAYASAIEARSDATPKSDAAEGESAVAKPDAQGQSS